jgi:serpin B
VIRIAALTFVMSLAAAFHTLAAESGNLGSGALCAKCRDMMFTTDIGKCPKCGRETSSGAFKFCQSCARELGQCQACGAPLGGAGTSAPAAGPGPDAEAALVAGNTAFACELYAQLRAQEGNLFLSPYSISSALAMTCAGARGNTAAEMKKALRLTVEDERLHAGLGALTRRLNDGGKGGQYQLAVANALWGQKDYKFLDSFLALNEKHYGAGLSLLDFKGATEGARGTINAWVEKQTKERIKDLLRPGVLTADTRLVLTNAIYFKGDWAEQFAKDATRDEPFHPAAGKTVAVPMMHRTAGFGYLEGEGFQALSLPYKGDALSMVVFLPGKAGSLTDFERSLTAENLARWLPQLGRREVEVSLPKFKVTAEFSLARTLEAMGMKDAFAAGAADFSGMDGTKELFIGAVVHKAFVAVDEKGTEAAAATGVVMALAAAPEPPPAFKADRPFVFAIRDNASGSILFLGRVADPKAD